MMYMRSKYLPLAISDNRWKAHRPKIRSLEGQRLGPKKACALFHEMASGRTTQYNMIVDLVSCGQGTRDDEHYCWIFEPLLAL